MTQRSRQSGAALLMFAALLVLISATVLLDRLSTRVQLNANKDQKSIAALSEAKTALIGWSVGHSQEPGRLPWPDRNNDAYDGLADCVTAGFVNTHLLGRLPYAGDAAPCDAEQLGVYLLDGAREPLWYAVSRNLLWNRGQAAADPPINPGLLDGGASYPWLTVRDQNGNVVSSRVAAVIIAPGRAIRLENGTEQDRSAAAPNPNQFLDHVTIGATTYDNSDNDLDFIQYPDSRTTASEADAFNDRLVYITIDELIRPVEKRVLGDAAIALENYRTTNGRYPWLSPFVDPRSLTGTATGGSATTLSDSNRVGSPGTDPDSETFTSANVAQNDLVLNITTGTSGRVTSATGTTVTFSDPLVTGVSFSAGDSYEVRRPFNGDWGTREGHIPYIDSGNNESFQFETSFTATWTATSGASSSFNPWPPPLPSPWVALAAGQGAVITGSLDAARNASSLTVPASSGQCLWTNIDNVDCTGTVTQTNLYTVDLLACIPGPVCSAPFTRFVTRTYEMNFSYTDPGTDAAAPPAAIGIKTRDDVINTDASQTVTITDTVDLPAPYGTRTVGAVTVSVPVNQLTVSGIYLDLEEGVEFPGYFFTNNWHHYIYAAMSASDVSGGGGNCTGAANCLTLTMKDDEDTTADSRTDVRALVISAGSNLGNTADSDQNRSDVSANITLADYFEDANNVSADDAAVRRVLSDQFDQGGTDQDFAFNDQVRVVGPNPP